MVVLNIINAGDFPQEMTELSLLVFARAISALAEPALPISESLEILILERGLRSAYKTGCTAML